MPRARQVKERGWQAVRMLAVVVAVTAAATNSCAQRPADIIDIQTLIPDIELDIRYFTSHNFVGRPIPGYEAPKCLLTRRAAEALARVQEALHELELSLKIYDCYRPQPAVDYFIEWAQDLADQEMKAEFYPSVEKSNLLSDGYIAARSGHSRGSTIDLTITLSQAPASDALAGFPELKSCEDPSAPGFPDGSLDMGTPYDCFSILSHTMNATVSFQQRANRLLLKHLMESHGFENLPEEWWHFTFSNEPYPASYFDFLIR